MNSFRDKTVWITGASSGIGEALAYAFARQGAALILSARDESALAAVGKECLSMGAAVQPRILPFDIGAHAALPTIARRACAWRDGVDLLINNAGVGQRATALDTDPAVLRQILDVNFMGPVLLTQAVLPSMLARGTGRIVVVSSVLGKFHLPGRSAYVASKHALQGYFDTLRAELHGSGVGITVVCPGWIATRISQNALTAQGKRYAQAVRSDRHKMSAEQCARRILRAIAAGKREAKMGGPEIFGGWVRTLAPRLYDRLARNSARAFIHPSGATDRAS